MMFERQGHLQICVSRIPNRHQLKIEERNYNRFRLSLEGALVDMTHDGTSAKEGVSCAINEKKNTRLTEV